MINMALDRNIKDLTPDGLNLAGVSVKNVCIAKSGIYQYALTDLPRLGLSLDSIPDEHRGKFIFNVYRPPDVLKKRKDLFARKFITVEHPKEWVTVDNAKKYQHGFTGDSVSIEEKDGDVYVDTTATFTTREVLDYYNSYKEVSPGYTPVLEWENGECPDGKYEIVLRDIQDVNHIAVTKQGRGGSDVRVLDSGSNLFADISRVKEKKMVKWLTTLFKPKVLPKETILESVNTFLDSVPVATDSAAQKVYVAGVKASIADIPDSEDKKVLDGYLSDIETACDAKIDIDMLKQAVALVKDLAAKVILSVDEKTQSASAVPAAAAVDTSQGLLGVEPKQVKDFVNFEKELSVINSELSALRACLSTILPDSKLAPAAVDSKTKTAVVKPEVEDESMEDVEVIDALSALLAKRKKKQESPSEKTAAAADTAVQATVPAVIQQTSAQVVAPATATDTSTPGGIASVNDFMKFIKGDK